MQPTLDFMSNLARRAGGILRAGFGQRHQIDHKGVIDLVTDVDRKSESLILSEIRGHFPEDAIIAEESGYQPGQACCVWYVDPLDGTVNYAHGVPIFSVSIAYAQEGELLSGVVYDPLRDELFSATFDQPARLNGNPIHVSQNDDLDQSLLVTGFPYDVRTNPENNLQNYTRFALRTHGVRRLGSAALDLCYVAAGRFDGYWEIAIEPWDLAAGALIARQAGARVTTVKEGGDILTPPCSILVANPELHEQMRGVLEEQL